MFPKTHIIIGLIVSLLALFIFPAIGFLGASIIFLSSFLIDVDHYLYYVYKQKDHNLARAYRWFVKNGEAFYKLKPEEQKKYKRTIFLFHGIEFWVILLLLLMLFNEIFLFILIGIVIHMILDFIDIYNKKQPYYIKISQIYTHRKNKTLREFI